MIISNILKGIGNTPLIRLKKIEEKYNLNSEIYAKIEGQNLGGSIKSRVALRIIETALKEGKINKETVIIEATSGNTGIGLASISAYYGLKFIAVMPSNMSKERMLLMKMYGSEVILTPAEKGMKGSLEKVEELKKLYPNHFLVNQFENAENINAHYHGTAEEILLDLPSITTFVAGGGTGGTITGVAKRLKEYNKEIKVVLVEPEESPLIKKGYSGRHKIEGIGANFIPKNIDLSLVDFVENVSFEDAKKMMFELASLEGLFIGYSSAAALVSTIRFLKEKQNEKAVVIFPDFGERYLSTIEEENDMTYISKLENKNILGREEINDFISSLEDYFFPGYFKEIKNHQEVKDYLISIFKRLLENRYDEFINEFKELNTILKEDIETCFKKDPSLVDEVEVVLSHHGFYAIFIYRVAHLLYKFQVPYLPRQLLSEVNSLTGIDIHPGAKIGHNFFIDHGNGVVIGETSIIGNNVSIYQGVTIGALSLKKGRLLNSIKRHPTIKDNVIIYANATILGGETIVGENAVIGANAFVTKSVNPNELVKMECGNKK